MPGYPDITLYLEQLRPRMIALRRVGKRIVFTLEDLEELRTLRQG